LEITARRRRAEKLSIGAAMLLIAGFALGLWLARYELQNSGLVFVPGGLALVGVPLLLFTARRRPWGPGRILWFASGTAAWLLWPPVVYRRISGLSLGARDSMSGECFFYGTSLMAVYVTAALLAGGFFRRSRRRRLRRSWQEVFGLLLGLVFASTGLYLIAAFYSHDLTSEVTSVPAPPEEEKAP